jgi:predicted nucleic acid-binding protein
MALPARLFCDTSFFYACFDQHDVNHEQAKQLSEEAVTVSSALYVTWDIISETLTLLRYRRTYREALTFLTEVKPHLRIVNYGRPCAQKRNKFSGGTAVTVNFLSATRYHLSL